MPDLGMNERAWTLADQMAARAAELRIAVHTLACGARVLDAGIAASGGFAAGLALAEWVSRKSGLACHQLTFAAAPTASLAGAVQIAARVVETGLHKMDVIGFDVTRVGSACGTAPLAPIARNDLRAIGRTNDCILY